MHQNTLLARGIGNISSLVTGPSPVVVVVQAIH
jgi:hypothetical protein